LSSPIGQASSFLENVLQFFDRAAHYTGLDPRLLEQIRCCNSLYRMMFPVRGDDGGIVAVEGFPASSPELMPTESLI
jgi:glutamate dehydrogenase (NAD(P)+)